MAEYKYNVKIVVNVDVPELTGRQIGKMFMTEMVQAIQKGWKVQTRRLDGLKEINENPDIWTNMTLPLDVKRTGFFTFYEYDEKRKIKTTKKVKARYRPGDIIYVKETWAENHELLDNKYSYRADSMNPAIRKWKSSMFMPKKAARILLLVTSVHVERLQSISADDANFEGIRLTRPEEEEAFIGDRMQMRGWDAVRAKYIQKFKDLWIKINGQESWDKNPWVQVVKFKKIPFEKK